MSAQYIARRLNYYYHNEIIRAFPQICHLEDEAYFGELALLMENERWIASVVAAENCEVYVLSRVDFQYILTPYPDLLVYLRNVALARPEQIPLLEKVRELDSPTTTSENINISNIKVKRRKL